jgi:hypothetical protein
MAGLTRHNTPLAGVAASALPPIGAWVGNTGAGPVAMANTMREAAVTRAARYLRE